MSIISPAKPLTVVAQICGTRCLDKSASSSEHDDSFQPDAVFVALSRLPLPTALKILHPKRRNVIREKQPRHINSIAHRISSSGASAQTFCTMSRSDKIYSATYSNVIALCQP